MSIFKPKRKTGTNTYEDVEFPISCINGLQNALDGKSNKANGIYYVVGTGTTAGTWTGTCSDITEYYDGLTIAYKVNVKGANTTTLDINGFGARTVYMRGTTKVTTHYAVNTVIIVVYTTVSGTGRWYVNDYDANTTYSSKTAVSNGTDTSLVTTGEKYIWNTTADTVQTIDEQVIPDIESRVQALENAGGGGGSGAKRLTSYSNSLTINSTTLGAYFNVFCSVDAGTELSVGDTIMQLDSERSYCVTVEGKLTSKTSSSCCWYHLITVRDMGVTGSPTTYANYTNTTSGIDIFHDGQFGSSVCLYSGILYE